MYKHSKGECQVPWQEVQSLYLDRLEANNFKIFTNLDLQLDGKSTIVFGVNGTGKSSVLEIINYLFRVWVNRLNSAQGKAFEKITSEQFSVGSGELTLKGEVRLEKRKILLTRTYKETRPGQKQMLSYDKGVYADFVDNFVELYLSQENNMPIFVNYGTNRAVLDIPLRIRNKHEFSQVSAFERAVENELDFRTFFEWYRNQEDIENQIGKEQGDFGYEDIQLKCVRQAVGAMLGEMSDLRVRRNPLCMVVKKAGKELRVDLLSDGEKCTLALLGDLARRMAIANPWRGNPLEGKGIVLIDEIELHMHPSWQRKVLRILKEVFPNIQFIITTHSPQVLGEADDSYNIFELSEEAGACKVKKIKRMDGYDSNLILEDYMGTDSKNASVKALVQEINHLITVKEYEKAEKLLENLAEISGTISEDYILSKGYLKRSKILDEKD